MPSGQRYPAAGTTLRLRWAGTTLLHKSGYASSFLTPWYVVHLPIIHLSNTLRFNRLRLGYRPMVSRLTLASSVL